MLRRVSSHELEEWQVFYNFEPWGNDADDFHTAQIVHAIAEVNRNPKKRGRKYKIADFIPDWEKAYLSRQGGGDGTGAASSPEAMEAMLKGFTQRFRAKQGAKTVATPESDKGGESPTILGPDGKPAR